MGGDYLETEVRHYQKLNSYLKIAQVCIQAFSFNYTVGPH